MNLEKDSYIQAVEERRAQESAYLTAGFTSSINVDAPVVPDRDEFREAARELLREAVERHEPLGHAAAESAHAAYEERRRNAQLQVRLADKLDEPVDDETRRLAETPSKQTLVDDWLAQRAEQRAAALRQVDRPVTGRNDGSRVDVLTRYQGDARGWQFDAERVLSRSAQVAHHREMAEAASGDDVRLRRRSPR